MNAKSKPDSSGSPKHRERPWRRMALAIPVSLILHVIVALLLRPQYRPVSDFAVDFDVIEVTPKPPTPPSPPSEPKRKKETVSKAESTPSPKKPKPKTKPKPVAKPDEPSATVAVHDIGEKHADAGSSKDGRKEDAGSTVSDGGVDAGIGSGGICMHNLFGFVEPDPAWMMWISMASFRETAFQKAIGATLTTFALGRRLSLTTGIDPAKDTEGLLVTAQNIFDPHSFRVVASYDSGEAKLRRKLEGSQEKNQSLSWLQTKQGWEATLQEKLQWHLVGSGRVLVVTHPSRKQETEIEPPLSKPTSTPSTRDAGPAAPQKTTLPSGSFSHWPREIGCISRPEFEADRKDVAGIPLKEKKQGLVGLARSFLLPDKDGHWPVALFATGDARAVGLGMLSPRRAKGKPIFRYALARAYFADPIRIEGKVVFKGTKNDIAALAEQWRHIAAVTAKDPFFAMIGLNHIFDGLALESVGEQIEFSLKLTEGEIRGALIFLQLQGEALERHLKQ
ncbi:MAG: hypothetical protein GY847_37580 [Proteobacteria bacterium]|nr:hypothetical protein [Pseudomonadota bacterium]